MILDAAKTDARESRPALDQLCRTYWEPLYYYACSMGKSHQDAEDITQAFFQHLLVTNLPSRAKPELGRFRSYLLTSMRHFILTAHRNATVQKRGGKAEHLRLDDQHEERQELSTASSIEATYDRHFAHALVSNVLDQLANQQAALGNESRFNLLRPLLLLPENGAAAQKELSTRLGMTETNIRTSLSRLRAQFRDLVRKDVARIVDDPADVNDEIAYLLKALR